MAYAIRVRRGLFRHSGRHRNGWISAFGYTISENLESARRFTKKDAAESYALLLVVKVPDYIGKLEAVPIIWDDGWKEKKENRHGSVLRGSSGQPGRGVSDGR